MALIRRPYQQGQTVDLRGPRGAVLVATAPDGLQVRLPAPNGRATLWLPQVGEWRYQWQTSGSDGPSGALTVTSPADQAGLPETGTLTLHASQDRMGTSLATIHTGERFPVTATLRGPEGMPVTGATVTGRAMLHGRDVTLGAATDNSDGTYTLPFTPHEPGPWHVRLESVRPRVAAEGVINVRRTRFT